MASSAHGIGISLNTGRIIDDSSDIIEAVDSGNVKRARQLFAEGLASPQDVGGGIPLLHVGRVLISGKRVQALTIRSALRCRAV